MERNQARVIGKMASWMAWLGGGGAVVAWLAAVGLAMLVWVDWQRARTLAQHAGAWALLCVLHALLTVSLERGLAYTSLGHRWRYRLAFLASASLSVVHGLVQWAIWILSPTHYVETSPHLEIMVLRLIVAMLGAFAGGVFATAINEGLWENNSPPSTGVQEEVYRIHQQVIGAPGPGPWSKRGFDICLAALGLVLSAPVWLLSAFAIWFEEPGPIFFVKNSVGRGGVNFHQFKFRTMVYGAEENTGPILAQQGDQRVLLFGYFLRKTALDELPQLLNILCGQMSFVGPRPQRTVLVHGYLQSMPEYAERHRVLPGLAGLAQVAGDYYLTPRQKLRFDRLYIRYVGLGFDFKLVCLAFLVTFWLRWQKGWDGRLPRRLLRLGRWV
jgi:lipopolysaccharide/colanic/teichoic acid biosynthesis glycosyltransferase